MCGIVLLIFLLFCFQGPPQPGQPFKFTVGESCDRIKEEFNFLQAQYHKSVSFCVVFFAYEVNLDTSQLMVGNV